MAAYFARKSIFFLISFNILICFSYANNFTPHGKHERELLGLSGGVVGLIEHVLPKAEEYAAKKLGQSIVGKLFGSNGQQGFRVGWKAGKLYYSVANKCENYTAGFECEQPVASVPCNNTCGDNHSLACVVYCGVEVLEITGLVDRCFQNCGVPIETPCSYVFNGNVTCTQTSCGNLPNGTITCPS